MNQTIQNGAHLIELNKTTINIQVYMFQIKADSRHFPFPDCEREIMYNVTLIML